MLLTGETISAERAGEIGLVKRVVSPETLDVEVETLARCIASKSSAVITSGKQIFYRQLELPLGDAYGLAGHAIACDFSPTTEKKAWTRFSASAHRGGQIDSSQPAFTAGGLDPLVAGYDPGQMSR